MDPEVYRSCWVEQIYYLDTTKTVLAPNIDRMYVEAVMSQRGCCEVFKWEYYRTAKNRFDYNMYYIYPKHILYNYCLFESLKPEIEEFDKSKLKNPWRKIKSARK